LAKPAVNATGTAACVLNATSFNHSLRESDLRQAIPFLNYVIQFSKTLLKYEIINKCGRTVGKMAPNMWP